MGFLDDLMHNLMGLARPQVHPQPQARIPMPAPGQDHVPISTANSSADRTAQMLSAGVSAPVAPRPQLKGNLTARLIQSSPSSMGGVIDNRGVASTVPINNNMVEWQQLQKMGPAQGMFEDGRYIDYRNHINNNGPWNND